MSFGETRRPLASWQLWIVLTMACAGEASKDGFTVHGTVQHLDVEGGVYLIVVGDTTRYQPIDLPPDFREDGLRVLATIELADVMTTGQAGTPVTVIAIERDSAR